MKLGYAVGLVLAIAIATWLLYPRSPVVVSAGALVDVTVPQLSPLAIAGRGVFDANCAACHGRNASGVDGAGPPLVHIIYEPSHHGDGAFYLAVENGVRAHHWRFGNMAAVPGVDRDQINTIVTYIRELQRANGIT